LLGDYSKAKKVLKWKPKTSLFNLIKDMINSELNS
jgi:GDP-D-mannose dehydratase